MIDNRPLHASNARETKKFTWLNGLMLFAIILRILSEPTANLSYFLIAGYAIFGRQQAIEALALSWFFTMINPSLAPDASYASAGRYLVIFSAAISIAWRSAVNGKIFRTNSFNLLTIFLGIFLLLHSLLFSVVVDVSILKSLSWTITILTLLSAWQGLTSAQHEALFSKIQSGLISLILLSLPFLAIPSIGYLRNGTGFQGILNHPQAFGPTVALVGVLIGGRVLGERKPAWRDIVLLGMCLILVILSEARTAGLAMFLGLLGSAFLSPIFAGVSRKRMLPGLRSKRLNAIALIAFAAVIIAAPFVASTLSSYLLKRSNVTSFTAAADVSRGELVIKMLSNIQEKPLTGIGFGISSDPLLMEIERDPFLGIPLSALVEKGVMPVAVVEELGIFGGLLIFSWFLMILRRGARSGVSQFAVLITALLVNLGESMLFSAGGMGILLLILLSGSATGNQRKNC